MTCGRLCPIRFSLTVWLWSYVRQRQKEEKSGQVVVILTKAQIVLILSVALLKGLFCGCYWGPESDNSCCCLLFVALAPSLSWLIQRSSIVAFVDSLLFVCFILVFLVDVLGVAINLHVSLLVL